MEAIEILGALSTPAGRADPYPLYARLHEIGEVILAGQNDVLVVGYEAISSVLRDPGFGVCDEVLFDRLFPSWRESPAYVQVADWILNVNEPRHTRIRRLIARAFSARRIAALESAIVRLTDELLDAMADRGADGSAVDFMDDFAYLLPVTLLCDMIGIPQADRDRFRPIARDLAGVFEFDLAALPAMNAAAAQAFDYFAELAAKRRAEPRDDLLTALLAISDSDVNRLTCAELLHNLTMLMVAGFETTTSMLGNGLQILLQDPSAGAAIRDGSVSPVAFVEEVLRFDPAVQYTRRVGYDTSVGDVPVSGETGLMLVLGAGNRDPRRFADPGKFDPLRPDGGPLSFGGGAHFCIGAALARLEGAVAFPRLLNRFPDVAPAGEPVRRSRQIFLRGFDALPVTLK